MGAASKEIGTDGSGTTGRVQSVSEDDDASDGASSEVGKRFLNKVTHKNPGPGTEGTQERPLPKLIVY